MFVFKSKYNSKLAEIELLKKELNEIKSLYKEVKNKKSKISNEFGDINYDFSLIVKEKDKNIGVLKGVIEKLESDSEKQKKEILELKKIIDRQKEKQDQNIENVNKTKDSKVNKEEDIRCIFRKSYSEIKTLTKKIQEHYCDNNISSRTIERIFLYLEVLEEMNGNDFINSVDFGKMTDIKSTTIRKDMTWLKINGIRGKGYSIKTLRKKLEKFIFIDGLPKKSIKKENTKLENNIELYKEIGGVSSEEWFSMANWAKEKEMFDGWVRKFLFTLGVYKKNNGRLTEKQIEGISKVYLEMKNTGFFEHVKMPPQEVKPEKTAKAEKMKNNEEEVLNLTFNQVLEAGLKSGFVKAEILTKINYTIEKNVKDIYEAVEILEDRGIIIN